MPQVVNAEETRKTYFGEKAAKYDEGRETCPKWNAEHEAVSRFLAPYREGSVLDIPIGTGRFLSLYRDLGFRCIGMDVSEDMMVQARAKCAEAFIRDGDLLDIPLPDQTVDYAVCIRLLTLIDTPDMVRGMAELGRVTRKAIIVSTKVDRERSVQRRSITHPESVFLKAVSDAGFSVADRVMCRPPHYYVYHLTR